MNKPVPNQRKTPQKKGGDWMRIERPVKTTESLPSDAEKTAIELPIPWFKALIGVLLLPVCWMATMALLAVFNNTNAKTLLHSEEVWLFCVGFLIWLLCFFLLPRPTGIYVVGHELTHAIFVILCGGRIGHIHTTHEGGYILTDKNNFLIALSPYIIPFWTLVSLGLLGGMRLWLEIPWFDRVLFFTTGTTWAFHITFTIDMILKGQPDIEENGRFFSLILIYLCNILLISALLVIASPSVVISDLGRASSQEAVVLFESARELFTKEN